MGNPLLDLQPHKVSRDLRGYSVMFYGKPKTGKTTTASKFPGAILAAFERGYNALTDVFVWPLKSWPEFRKFIKYLEDETVQEKFQTIVIDTADIAYDLCVKYICSRESTAEVTYETIGDIPYGKGYVLAMQEFDEQLRKILQLNYGLVIISHETEKTYKDENGKETTQIIPTVDTRGRRVCERTCDIIGYVREVQAEDGLQTRLFLRGTPRFIAGSRFRYTPDSIEFNYENLVNAIAGAIEEEASNNFENVTNENFTSQVYAEAEAYNFPQMMQEFQEIVGQLIQKSPTMNSKITSIIDKHLGKGKKVTECTEANAPQLDLILFDLRTLL